MPFDDPYRPVTSVNRTPVQQSLSQHPADQRHYAVGKIMLGVILEVYPADDPNNRSAMYQGNRHGHFNECKVLILNDNGPASMELNHVLIPPMGGPSGLDDYEEQLPRGSSHLVDGSDLPASLSGVDPYNLDGDWCIIGFIGNSLDQPFILGYWPHPRNFLDTGTSGQGDPDSSGSPRSLNQRDRYFRRVNGVETVVTREGDIYVNTTYANAALQFSSENAPTRGRWSRQIDEENGGSIQIVLKPSQTLELEWNPLQDGVGIRGRNEPELPQQNPRPRNRSQNEERENTYIIVDKDRVRATVAQSFVVESGGTVQVSADETTTISGTNEVIIDSDTLTTVEAETVKLGEDASQPVIKGQDRVTDDLTFGTALIAFVTALKASTDGAVAAAATTFEPLVQNWINSLPGHLSSKVFTE